VTRRCGPVYLRLPNSSQGVVPPYSSAEVAMAIGVSLDTFYRTRQIRHARDGLPAPISERGPLKMGTYRLRRLADSASSDAPQDDR
jgi:hypothetical protein